jgi:hypothetical protein
MSPFRVYNLEMNQSVRQEELEQLQVALNYLEIANTSNQTIIQDLLSKVQQLSFLVARQDHILQDFRHQLRVQQVQLVHHFQELNKLRQEPRSSAPFVLQSSNSELSQDEKSRTILLKRLPSWQELKASQLETICSQFGTVVGAVRIERTIGIVTFDTQEAATAAIRTGYVIFRNHFLRIKAYDPFQIQERQDEPDNQTPNSAINTFVSKSEYRMNIQDDNN